ISANKGMLLAQNSTIENFNNQGTIQGPQVGIETNAKINTFINNGLIKATASGEWSNGIWVSANSNIQTFTNTETIEGGGSGIRMAGGTIGTLTNSGSIQGKYGGGIRVTNRATINQIDNSGIINGLNTWQGAISISDWYSRLTVHTIKNSGTLTGGTGIDILHADIDLIENSGTIIGTVNSTTDAGIQLHSSSVGTIINSGYIKSKSYGIQLATESQNTTLNNLINSGTIEGDLDGLLLTQKTNLKTIENTGVIKGGNAGINIHIIDFNWGKNGTVGTIVNKGSGEIVGNNYGIIIPTSSADYKVEAVKIESGKVEGTNGAGIALGADQDISTSIEISGKDTVVTGGQAGIVNEGNLGANGSGGITISGGATITSNSGNGSGIVNQGNGSISGSITVSDGASIEGG
ncbi:hypothetical protein KJK83_001823, partial [Campylobacter jejuni]|nr:hypothetical protein [Campylobacter jejuni]